MRPGDVYWVDFPAPTSRVQANRRPVIVLQDDRVAARSLLAVMVPLTTTDLTGRLPCVVPVDPDAGNGLTARSFALVSQIRAVDRPWFDRQAGVIAPATLAAIFSALDRLTGRPVPPGPAPVPQPAPAPDPA